MRIASNFRDFYDAGQAQGVDLSRVFVRYTAEVDYASRAPKSVPAQVTGFWNFAKRYTPGAKRFGITRGDRRLDSVEYGLVLFAGKLYPFAVANILDSRTSAMQAPSAAQTVFYDLESLNRALRDFEVEIPTKQDSTSARMAWATDSRNAVSFMALKGSESFQIKAMEDQLGIAAYVGHIDKIAVNPRLNDYAFYKVFTPREAYQELEMYMGNLAAPERVTVHIADKDRIAQRGFDKMSFRKAPSA